MKSFRYSVGPWNIHTGMDPFGPPVRKEVPFEHKLARLKEIGFDAIQLHDDDAIPNVNDFEGSVLRSKAKELKQQLRNVGLVPEFIAPRLWEDERTRDGAYTANSQQLRNYAKERSLKALEIAEELGTNNIVLWLAREGTFVPESKCGVRAVEYLVEAINYMLEANKNIRILIEPKPNEPVDKSFIPTAGHALALSYLTSAPDRVGVLIESAHSLLAGLDPADDMTFALAHNKLWGVHLNDQNGLKFDQDRSFGSVNLRQAFNQVRVLLDHQYGQEGQFVGLDVKALRTQNDDLAYKHLSNSLFVVERLVQKAKSLQTEHISARQEDTDYEELDRLIVDHLLGS
ncbi:xylose isomerase [Paenibacillus agaridevorans]|uniref:Xylose isomerase n=1 Tax=Paenibacillus agaridevorans TaxID=171404 RepID=A0A2R5EQX1_9BACL|nr:TIM barrel protein [Paenibacillus agaridevorans]GBG08967.1 xylose isomerase [Paenibacillus agaridevorans]